MRPLSPKSLAHHLREPFYLLLFRGAYNVVVALEGDKWQVETFNALDKTLHPQISPEELQECEDIVRADPQVQALAKEVGT